MRSGRMRMAALAVAVATLGWVSLGVASPAAAEDSTAIYVTVKDGVKDARVLPMPPGTGTLGYVQGGERYRIYCFALGDPNALWFRIDYKGTKGQIEATYFHPLVPDHNPGSC